MGKRVSVLIHAQFYDGKVAKYDAGLKSYYVHFDDGDHLWRSLEWDKQGKDKTRKGSWYFLPQA